MARFQIKHGENIEVATLSEIQALLAEQRAEDRRARVRVRAAETLKLDNATGNGTIEVYSVPVGYEFEVRRVFLDLDSASDPGTGNRTLNAAGVWADYRRSGSRIEYANPVSPLGYAAIPGIQTWGAEQGPYLVNGETFEVHANNLGNGAILTAMVEGILARVKAQ